MSETVYVNYYQSAFQFTTVNSTDPAQWTPWTPTVAYNTTASYTLRNDNSPVAFTFDKGTTSMDWQGNDAHGCSHSSPTGSINEITFSVTNDSTDDDPFYLSLVVGIVITSTKQKVQSPDPQIILDPDV